MDCVGLGADFVRFHYLSDLLINETDFKPPVILLGMLI